MAFSLLTSPALRQALDIRREPMAVRERYGMTLFGQAAWPPGGWSRRGAGS